MRRATNPTVLAWSLVAIALGGGVARSSDESRPPNIVFLYTDDQARWAVGAYGNGEIRTPNLDRLAREGALAVNAFTVTPVCSPSRAAMFTGLYPSRLGIDDWINPRSEPDLGVAPSAIGWPELLKARGYATGLMGKWHLGTRDEFHPTHQGFDEFFGFRGGGNSPMDPTLEVDGREQKLEGSLPDLLVDRGLEFLDAHKDGPFLLAIHFRAPHAPYAPVPEVDSAPYADLDPTIPDYPDLPVDRVKRLTREYYASVGSVDRNVGRVLDKLEALGIAEDTIVIFTSDHGYMIGHHGLWHKGNAVWIAKGQEGPRPNMFEESIRVPLIVRWPGKIREGVRIVREISNLDLFPTILDLILVGVPANLKLDGESFAPALVGIDPLGERSSGFQIGQYDMHHYKVARMRMIRTRDWKLIRHFEPGGVDELYHLADDPGETRNLAASAEHRRRYEQLNQVLQGHLEAIGDTVAAESEAATTGR